ncbi:MAG TPA: hypothetical protein PK867_22010, partial [Pirellulales bacterium]|nr:hypothetical protein [Pirellulales bacterium]
MMSEQAAKNFADSEERRLGQNDARRIMGERDKARSPSGDAARRWPFELLQNAHDPGPRDGETFVNVEVSHSDSLVTFRHDGRPFSSDDLAALVSGGSNKDYDSAETTGRYGTGFLVTHVLSTQFSLSGMLDVSPHLERFQIRLDRSGDANAILSNAKAAKRDIAAATRVAGSPEWTAEFAFPLDSASAAEDGLEVLNGSAPFLFGTCEHLGRLTIVNGPALPETWEREEVRQHTWQNLRVDDRLLAFKKGGTATKYRILRVSLNIASDVAVLVLLRLDGAALQFVNPTASLPRIFTRLPIRGATFLPINVIIDGQFNALRERDRIAMAEGDREKLSVALRLIPPMMQMAMEEDWRSCHWICRMAKVEKGFSDNESETEFWNEELKGVAQHLATLPIVKTEDGYLPAASDNGRYADFIVPRYSRASPCDEVELLPVWELAEQTKVLDPTVRELVRDWNEVTSGWESLGISLARRGLKEIGEEVSKAADELADLPVKVAPLTWIARFLDTLGQLPERYDCAILMDGLLPSQCGHLSAIASLSFDAEIPDDLKDLAETIGHAVRDRMLDATLATLGADDGYPFLQKVLHAHITNRLTEEMVLKECIDHVSSQLPDGENAEQGGELERGSVNLLRYIWK